MLKRMLCLMGGGCLVVQSVVYAEAPSKTLDLAVTPPSASVLSRIYGHGSDDDGLKGVPVCGGFDCDGDGHRDYGFSQFQADPLGRLGAGEATLVFGNGGIGTISDAAVFQANILRIAGAQAGETTGDEVWMDELTGDGKGDFIIGRQNHTPVVDRPGAGALTMIIGDAALRTHAETLTHLDLANPPAGIKIVTFVGPSSYDRLGIWMRTGDITGDGIADILVGADEVDGAGLEVSDNRGAAFVIRGGSHLLNAPAVVDLADFGTESFPEALKGHVARIDPPAASVDFHFGGTVQVADLDGNGRAEVLIAATLNRAGATVRLSGAPAGTGEGVGGSQDGTVFIVWDENFPPWDWENGYRFTATRPPIGDYTRIDGEALNQSFGEELIGGLDFSGDGFAELFVGDLVADPQSRVNAGRGYVFYNAANLRGLDFDLSTPPDGVVVTRIDGPVASAISSDTVLQGDFDGDGIGDLGIGNPHDNPSSRTNAGSVHVLYGQAGGWPALIDLRVDTVGLPDVFPGPDVMRIALISGANGNSGSNTGDVLCYSAAAGDIDRDGRTDLLVNEMAGDGSGGSPEDVGNLLVLSGSALLDPPAPALSLTTNGAVDFGTVDVEDSAVTQSITITNTSGGAVNISSLALAGPAAAEFSIQADSGQVLLASGATRVLTIAFDPVSVGSKGAALVVRTDVDTHPVAWGLSGLGIDTALQLGIPSFQLVAQSFILSLESQLGIDYTLQRSMNLVDWSSILIIPGTGQRLYFPDEHILNAGHERLFYRVQASPHTGNP